MFKKLMNKKVLKNEKGLTLIELLAVIVILAIVAAIAIPAIGNIIDNSRYKAVKSDALNAMNAAQIYFTDNPEGVKNSTGTTVTTDEDKGTTVTTGALKELGYLENEGTLEGRGATITKTNGALSIKSQSITYASGNTIEFDGATIDSISKDKTKAKDAAGKKLGASGVPTGVPK